VRYLLDTTVVIDFARGRASAVALVLSLFGEPNDVYVCDAVVTESLSSGSDDEVETIGALLRPLEYVSTSPDAARWAGASRRALRRTSRRELGDSIIAGVAWSLQATVVTRNRKDFEIQGVPVLSYE